MAEPSFDFSGYLRNAPTITVESGILLARTLVTAMPKRMPAQVKRVATKLLRVADEAQQALSQRQRELVQPLDESSREIDIAGDSIWSALRDMLDALARLPATYPRGAKARQLLAAIFPESTAFLRLPYSEQFVTMDTTLKRIESEGLAKTLDAVVGPEFLQEIRAVQPRYEAMVQRRLRDAGPAGSLSDSVRALQRVLLEYATAVVSTVDSDDPDTIAPAREALRPIDNHRDLTTGSSPRPTATPPEPSPAAPAAPEPSSPAPAASSNDK